MMKDRLYYGHNKNNGLVVLIDAIINCQVIVSHFDCFGVFVVTYLMVISYVHGSPCSVLTLLVYIIKNGRPAP